MLKGGRPEIVRMGEAAQCRRLTRPALSTCARNWRHQPKFVPRLRPTRAATAAACAPWRAAGGRSASSSESVKDGKPVSVPVANRSSCGACHYCEKQCPEEAISIVETPFVSSHAYWSGTRRTSGGRWIPASRGTCCCVSSGADSDAISYFDHLQFDACQVTNPPIDPLREPMELRTYLGRRESFGRAGRERPLLLRPDHADPLLRHELRLGQPARAGRRGAGRRASWAPCGTRARGGCTSSSTPTAERHHRAGGLGPVRREPAVLRELDGRGDQDRPGGQAGDRRAPAGREGDRRRSPAPA